MSKQQEEECHVVLLGDSTLDNIVWVKVKEETVSHKLNTALNGRVVNYAADGFTSEDTLNGAVPNISLVARKNAGDPFPSLGVDRVFKPLEHLEKLEGVTHVVLSVGGNDVREILGHLAELPQRLAAFLQNYPRILDRVRSVTPKVIIMLQYRPSFHMDASYSVYKAMSRLTGGGDAVETLNALMEEIYPPILALAKQHNLAIVDLPNTFDIYNSDLYCSQIEPSAQGGQLIADLLAHVVKNHDFSCSKFYFQKEGEIRSKHNDGSVWVIEPKDEQSRLYNMLIQGILKQGIPNAMLNDDDGDDALLGELEINEAAIKQIENMGFTNRNDIIRCLSIDGTVETAVAALLSS